MIAAYIPLYNNEEWSQKFRKIEGLHYVAIDNHSDDKSPEFLLRNNVEVVSNARNVGRLGNWEMCVNHFANSNHTWMKWLFAGDKLNSNAYHLLNSAIHEFSDARLVIAEYYIVDGSRRTHWKMFPETRMIDPQESMRLLAKRGNWFGSPIGHMVHKQALKCGYSFGDLPWVADMFFCFNLAKKCPVLYLAESIGEFHVRERRYYSQKAKSLSSILQEGVIRYLAADVLLEMTGDRAEHKDLVEFIDAEFECRVLECSLLATSKHLLSKTPVKTLARVLWQKFNSIKRVGR